MAYATSLAVLADPTRRRVFERLRAGPIPVNVFAAGLPVSRPAVSQHLKALRSGAGGGTQRGVRRIYSVRREGLRELRDWLDGFWDDALTAFKQKRKNLKGSDSNERASHDCGRAQIHSGQGPGRARLRCVHLGLSRWWPFNHGVGKQPIEKVLMEPRLGGRWLEISQDGTETPSPRSLDGSHRIAWSCSGRSTRSGSRTRR